MIVATRTLISNANGQKIEIPIRLYAPEKAKGDWICRFEIGWPEGVIERWGLGIDAIQAMLIAMQMIAAQVYTSAYHKAGQLTWLERGGGYGFPVTNNMRDLLEGNDKKFL
ncbi:MAG: hypothetical protein QOF19_482 [Alphaproteobacteria bacterium]|jgi:hypothetical protein|nr:hypothetical protein [Alphaproteobacteria bacterium]